ncbi:MAG TPA: glycoside hydrolase family 16 protein [Candidatus Limnocylindria bacterium]|jgi:hypothetical protein|nr:glycoside hydrolase family 16 protein [Candidatus Limnocylindria bacterium]
MAPTVLARRMVQLVLAFLAMNIGTVSAKSIEFSGHTWTVRPGGTGGPGPCHWSETNAWVDAAGQLHLKISHVGNQWRCAEVYTTEKLGFGRYQWDVIGRLDTFDRNIVLGLFPYGGPDGQNEIDIEIAHWGNPAANIGNFTVYPAVSGIRQVSRTFPFQLNGDYTTHRFQWQSGSVFYQMLHGHQTGNDNEITHWDFSPANALQAVPQKPLPLHLNLWLFQGKPPTDSREVEVVIKKFTYTAVASHKEQNKAE